MLDICKYMLCLNRIPVKQRAHLMVFSVNLIMKTTLLFMTTDMAIFVRNMHYYTSFYRF